MMNNKILKLQEHRPHLVISLIDDNSLVVPVSYIEDIIGGRQSFKANKDHEILIRTIVKEWYENVKQAG